MKLLIAEDDLSVCEMLQIFFKKEPFSVTFAHDGLQAELLFQRESWDLIILDLMLPGKDGITLLQEFRRTRNTPIIILTAKVNEQDRIRGLEMGADDYVSKPFSPMELIARMKAVTRRYAGNIEYIENTVKTAILPESTTGMPPNSGSNQDALPILRYKEIEIQLETRTVVIAERMITNLTPKEFELICLFVKHPRRVFTRDQLLESIWGYDYLGEERTIDVHIKRLRLKISSADRPFIGTVWGVGYKLEE